MVVWSETYWFQMHRAFIMRWINRRCVVEEYFEYIHVVDMHMNDFSQYSLGNL